MEQLKNWLQKESKAIQVECKSSEREYALTYEGSTSPHPWEFSFDSLSKVVNGVGDTLTEFVNSITNQQFDLSNEDEILKERMSQGWNIHLNIDKDRYHAWMTKTIKETDEEFIEEDRYGKADNFKDLINFLFVEYDENDPYVLERREEFNKLREQFKLEE